MKISNMKHSNLIKNDIVAWVDNYGGKKQRRFAEELIVIDKNRNINTIPPPFIPQILWSYDKVAASRT